MKKKVLFLVICVILGVTLTNAQVTDKQEVIHLFDDLQELIVSISDNIKPSVVHIDAVKKSNEFKYKVLASGLIVDERGYILTNEHVVDDAFSITVTLPSKLEYSAKIIGVDKQTDLALIKIETMETLTVPKMGNSDEVEVGEWVIAVGNPYGFDRTVSFGIVSGKGRVFPNLPLEKRLINEFIQTDAAIDPGSSGGPLVNLKGEVLGINSIGLGRGQGFTIPINIANDVKDKLLVSGTIDRAWLGVFIQPLSRDYAKYFGEPRLQGVLVNDVESGSPADKAGIKPKDIISEYQESKVSAENKEDLNKFTLLVSRSRVGEKVKLEAWRDGRIKSFNVTLGKQPKVKAEEYETFLGFTVKEITDVIYRQNMLEDRGGVFVSFVEVGGSAGKAELFEGDVIKKVEDEEVSDLKKFKEILENSKSKKEIMLTTKRGKNLHFVLILNTQEQKEK